MSRFHFNNVVICINTVSCISVNQSEWIYYLYAYVRVIPIMQYNSHRDILFWYNRYFHEWYVLFKENIAFHEATTMGQCIKIISDKPINMNIVAQLHIIYIRKNSFWQEFMKHTWILDIHNCILYNFIFKITSTF